MSPINFKIEFGVHNCKDFKILGIALFSNMHCQSHKEVLLAFAVQDIVALVGLDIVALAAQDIVALAVLGIAALAGQNIAALAGLAAFAGFLCSEASLAVYEHCG